MKKSQLPTSACSQLLQWSQAKTPRTRRPEPARTDCADVHNKIPPPGSPVMGSTPGSGFRSPPCIEVRKSGPRVGRVCLLPLNTPSYLDIPGVRGLILWFPFNLYTHSDYSSASSMRRVPSLLNHTLLPNPTPLLPLPDCNNK